MNLLYSILRGCYLCPWDNKMERTHSDLVTNRVDIRSCTSDGCSRPTSPGFEPRRRTSTDGRQDPRDERLLNFR